MADAQDRIGGHDMRIDELATRAGVPARTIRYYTQQGLLPPPNLQGRVGWYTPEHLERLTLIKDLQEKRYLPLSVIKTVLRRVERGIDIELVLAPLDRIFAPRYDTNGPTELTRAELAQRAGVSQDVVDAAEDMGFLFPVSRNGEAHYTADDLQMLTVAADFLRLDLPRELAELYRSSLEQIAAVQVRAFGQNVVAPLARGDRTPAEVRDAILDGYAHMSRTCARLVALLHRKLLQQAVEQAMSRADLGQRGTG